MDPPFSAAWLWHVVGVVGVVTRGSSRCVGAHIHGHMRSLRAQAVTSLVMEGSVAPSMFAVVFFACDCAVNAKAAALPCFLRQFGGLPPVDGGVEGGDAL